MKIRYTIKGWRGQEYTLTAKQLYDRIMEDKQSNYNWIASATELTRVCSEPTFPEEYAKKIKIAILICFVNLVEDTRDESYKEPTDDDAVYSCFNSLDGTDKNVWSVKHKYLKAIIATVRQSHFEIPIHWGNAYYKLCNEWEIAKFKELCEQEKLDFRTIFCELHEDFEQKVKAAEALGLFEADEKKAEEWVIPIISKFK